MRTTADILSQHRAHGARYKPKLASMGRSYNVNKVTSHTNNVRNSSPL